MLINNKFNVGEEVYTTYYKQIEYDDCHICKGKGKCEYNGGAVECPLCIGTGKISELVCVVPHTVKIDSIEATVYSEERQFIQYIFENPRQRQICVRERPECNVFATLEEAEQFAYKSNNPKYNGDLCDCGERKVKND